MWVNPTNRNGKRRKEEECCSVKPREDPTTTTHNTMLCSSHFASEAQERGEQAASMDYRARAENMSANNEADDKTRNYPFPTIEENEMQFAVATKKLLQETLCGLDKMKHLAKRSVSKVTKWCNLKSIDQSIAPCLATITPIDTLLLTPQRMKQHIAIHYSYVTYYSKRHTRTVSPSLHHPPK